MAAQDISEFKLLFALFDADNSGTLTRGELEQLLRSASSNGSHIDDGKVAEYLALADTDNSGDISVDEFVEFLSNKVPQGTFGLKSIFRTIDNNDDGSIEKGEFEQAKASDQNLNQTLVEILDKKFQANAATQVTYEQFVEGVNDYYKARS